MGYKKIIFFKSFYEELKPYSRSWFKRDLFSSFSVALLAIPQSVAYSLLAGLPPMAGLFSAIFGTIFMGALGSSKHLIAGPSTGIAILIQTALSGTLQTYYPSVGGMEREALTLQILGCIVFIMGITQLLAGIFHFGRFLQFVSRSVVLGYFSGVVLAILASQLFYFLGIPDLSGSNTTLFKGKYLLMHLHQIHWTTLFLGILSACCLLVLKKKMQNLPYAVLMLVFATFIASILNHSENQILQIQTLKDLSASQKPFWHIQFPYLDLTLINRIFPTAMAISFLSVLEVFSVSRGLAAKSGQQISSNQELFALGVSNSFLSFLSGALPSSGSLSRSTLNFQSKAKSRISAILSGFWILLFISFGWGLLEHIPLVALAALLIVMTPVFFEKEELFLCLKATRGDRVVFLLTMISCLIFTLDVAFFVGIILAIASYLRKAAVPYLVEYAFNASGHLSIVSKQSSVYRKVRIIGIGGELFFAAVDLFQNALQAVAEDRYVRVIVLRLNGVHYVDASMCLAILRLKEFLGATKRHLIVSGITPEVWHIFSRSGMVKKLGKDHLFLTDETKPQLSTWEACLKAQEIIEDEI